MPRGLRCHVRLPLVLGAAALGVTAVLAALAPNAAEAEVVVVEFDDTTDGAVYEEAVVALAEEGVIRGCAEEAFCPYETLTRAQLASVLAGALDLPPTEFRHFTDIEGSVHAHNIDALAEAGIARGCEEARFCPEETLTRAEMATFVYRAFELAEVQGPWFDDVRGVHAPAVDALAAEGIAAGCGDPLTAYCPSDEVLRWQAAMFVSRAMDLIDPAEVLTLEERAQLQAEIEAEQERLRQEEEERRRQEEEERRRQEERRAMWYRLAQCEANGNWRNISRNGLYYGGLQFHLQTWNSHRPSSYPSNPINATPDQQIFVAERVLVSQGWRAWPHCSRVLGFR